MTVSSPEPDCGRRTAGAGAAETLKCGFLNSHFQTGFTNPLDAAILSGVPEPADLATYRKLAERPYDFTRRLLSVVLQREGDVPLLVTKGAPESVVARASHVREDHTTRPIEAAEHERLAKLVDSASADGFRLVAVGSRALGPDELRAPAAGGAAASLDDAARLEHDRAGSSNRCSRRFSSSSSSAPG